MLKGRSTQFRTITFEFSMTADYICCKSEKVPPAAMQLNDLKVILQYATFVILGSTAVLMLYDNIGEKGIVQNTIDLFEAFFSKLSVRSEIILAVLVGIWIYFEFRSPLNELFHKPFVVALSYANFVLLIVLICMKSYNTNPSTEKSHSVL